jgi:hypothetical protein
MGISDWLRIFRTLHERAKAGGLSKDDADAYRAGCDELARALIAAQRLTVKPGDAPRHALRVARAVQVDLESATWRARATTAELGVSGFAALLAKAPPANEDLRCTMKIPGGAALETRVVAGEMKQQPGSVRASFSFAKLSDAERAALEVLVIDTALSQIAA